MEKIQMIIADTDKFYLEHLAGYFMEAARQCEIATFSEKTSLVKYLSVVRHTDILLADREMIGPELETADVGVKLCLAEDDSCTEGWENIKKYQKAKALLQEIMLKYAEATGKTESLKGNKRTRTVAFYSPAGGTGKTTLAIQTAAACEKAGLRTFYLNLEKTDSSSLIFERSPGSMSDIFLSLKTRGADTAVKVLASCKEDKSTGIHYISGPDSIMEYTELTQEEMKKLINSVEMLNEYDVLLLDLASEFHAEKAELLRQCDLIFVPVTVNAFGIRRLELLFHEDELHQEYHDVLKKMKLVFNKMDAAAAAMLQQRHEILKKLPVNSVIGRLPALVDPGKLLIAAESVEPVFRPLVKEIQGDRK